jgi:hypothetical protein
MEDVGPTADSLISIVNNVHGISEAAKVTTISAVRKQSDGHSWRFGFHGEVGTTVGSSSQFGWPA